MTTWARLLDQYQVTVERIEHALTTGDWKEGVGPPWQPPVGELPTPDADALARYRQLAARDQAARAALVAALTDTRDGLVRQRRRRDAGHAYARRG